MMVFWTGRSDDLKLPSVVNLRYLDKELPSKVIFGASTGKCEGSPVSGMCMNLATLTIGETLSVLIAKMTQLAIQTSQCGLLKIHCWSETCVSNVIVQLRLVDLLEPLISRMHSSTSG
jgi:hypothetical protein